MTLLGGSSQDGRKWLGSPPFISAIKAIWKGTHKPILRGQKLTMVISHLLAGMILQVEKEMNRLLESPSFSVFSVVKSFGGVFSPICDNHRFWKTPNLLKTSNPSEIKVYCMFFTFLKQVLSAGFLDMTQLGAFLSMPHTNPTPTPQQKQQKRTSSLHLSHQTNPPSFHEILVG